MCHGGCNAHRGKANNVTGKKVESMYIVYDMQNEIGLEQKKGDCHWFKPGVPKHFQLETQKNYVVSPQDPNLTKHITKNYGSFYKM